MPPVSPDRLYLVAASGIPAFRPIFDAFANVRVYNINPEELRELQSPDAGTVLMRSGENIASVLARLGGETDAARNLQEFMRRIVPGLRDFSAVSLGHKQTVEFRQDVKGSKHPWKFNAHSMSDGTLRALGVLTAIYQEATPDIPAMRLVGIEEPETALHPGAARMLHDALRRASTTKQIVVSSHSPELLDDPSIDPDSLFAVVADQGETKVGPIDSASKSALRDHLYTAGELLRMNQLQLELDLDDADSPREPEHAG